MPSRSKTGGSLVLQARPIDRSGGEDRPLDTDPAKVAGPVSLADGGDATEASPEAAGHVILKRNIARDLFALGQTGQDREHGQRAAADDPDRALPLREAQGQQISHESVISRRAVVGGNLYLDPRRSEIHNASQ